MDPIFVSLIDSMLTYAADSASAEQNNTLSPWFLPNITLWSGDPLDIDEIGNAFDRSSVGADYGYAYTNGGTTGEAAGAKVQSDYLATAERAFRIRHSSPIRRRAHAAGRRLAHAVTDGCIDRVRTYVQTMLSQ